MKILHAGCGGERLPPQFPQGEEIRLDADPNVNPDIVASIDDLGDIGPYDGIYCVHCLEHLHWDNAQKALREFHRVLYVGGFIYLQVPNLDGVRPTEDVIYETGNGLKITGLDMLFGCRQLSLNNHWMAHLCGFLPETLDGALKQAGFQNVRAIGTGPQLDAIGIKL